MFSARLGVNMVSARTTPGSVHQEIATPQAKANSEPERNPNRYFFSFACSAGSRYRSPWYSHTGEASTKPMYMPTRMS